MVETLQQVPEFEQKSFREIERKFLPIFPEQLMEYRQAAQPIEQYYLSHPDEPFNLRFRETINSHGEFVYTATLKDRGTMQAEGLDRLEVETPVSAELYRYYQSADAPIVRKLRAEANNHVSIDFFEDGQVIIEAENPIAWQSFVERHGDSFVEVTGDRQADNEWQAHLSFRRANNGQEAHRPEADLTPDDIVRSILSHQMVNKNTPVHIGGRSGSGKSTIVRQVQDLLREHGVTSTVLSTDDYHRGATWLTEHNDGQPWTKWDDAVVYDTATMALDLAKLRSGESIPQREIDFSIVEPAYRGVIAPTAIILIEGIYARHPDIASPDSLHFEMTTPLATCIGRRLLRDMRERPQFANPNDSLAYMLEEAEPAYRAQAPASLS